MLTNTHLPPLPTEGSASTPAAPGTCIPPPSAALPWWCQFGLPFTEENASISTAPNRGAYHDLRCTWHVHPTPIDSPPLAVPTRHPPPAAPNRGECLDLHCILHVHPTPIGSPLSAVPTRHPPQQRTPRRNNHRRQEKGPRKQKHHSYPALLRGEQACL